MTITQQEQAIFDHMNAGEWDDIMVLRETAREAGEEDRFQADFESAKAHYDEQHEAPVTERVANTAAVVEIENELHIEVEEQANE